jgi:hypothetical protein
MHFKASWDGLRVREARERLTFMLSEFRESKVKVIGTEPRNQVVLMAAKDCMTF